MDNSTKEIVGMIMFILGICVPGVFAGVTTNHTGLSLFSAFIGMIVAFYGIQVSQPKENRDDRR